MKSLGCENSDLEGKDSFFYMPLDIPRIVFLVLVLSSPLLSSCSLALGLVLSSCEEVVQFCLYDFGNVLGGHLLLTARPDKKTHTSEREVGGKVSLSE